MAVRLTIMQTLVVLMGFELANSWDTKLGSLLVVLPLRINIGIAKIWSIIAIPIEN